MSILLTSDIGFHELRSFLEKEGHKVAVCCVKDAARAIQQGPASAVILDWGDNPREGLIALRDLKVGHPEIPVIVLSGARSEETAVTAFRFGAKDYFSKPVNIPEVMEVIRNLIKLRSTSRERRFPYLTREGMVSSLLVSATTTMPPCILRAITHMADNLPKQMTLGELADEAGMSKFHLCRSFRKNMAMSPMQFFVAMRIERAKKLMEDTSLTITQTALEVGFNDASTFIAHFRKICGTTPTAFRKSLRQTSAAPTAGQ
jgi:AraC-like DNA-binding protein/CheY-like chemotaxis protein